MTKITEQGWIEQVVAALGEGGGVPLIEFLQRQRWFGGKGRSLADVHVADVISLSTDAAARLLAIVRVAYRGGECERYVVPLTIRPRDGQNDLRALIELPGSDAHEWICDGTGDRDVWICLYRSIAGNRELTGLSGSLVGRAVLQGHREFSQPIKNTAVLSAEQSNTSVVFDRRMILKLIRKLELGCNPESEMLEFLTTQTTYRDIPDLLGVLTYDDGAEDPVPATAGVLQSFVPNAGDGWRYCLEHLAGVLEANEKAIAKPAEPLPPLSKVVSGEFMTQLQRLGETIGRLHMALASRQEPAAFCPEPITPRDIERWQAGMMKRLKEVCHDLGSQRDCEGGLTAEEISGLEAGCSRQLADLQILIEGRVVKTRHHGDLHLGQVLKIDNGFIVIDFEGEPARSLEERRAKVSPLKDVAGMLRSFNYAAHAALKQRQPASAGEVRVASEWEQAARSAFLEGYRSATKPGQVKFLPPSWQECLRVMRVYELDKALYEVRYEMRNRPDWLPIPLSWIRKMIGSSQVH